MHSKEKLVEIFITLLPVVSNFCKYAHLHALYCLNDFLLCLHFIVTPLFCETPAKHSLSVEYGVSANPVDLIFAFF